MIKNIFKNVTLGADPEAFVQDNKSKEIISAEGLIGGSKDNPIKITDEGHAIQEDNVMVEFNIPPSDNEQDFMDNINYCKDYLNTMLGLHNQSLVILPSAELNNKFLNTEQAKMFGCEPDLNVYLRDYNEAPCSNTNLRTCGGHIHVGFTNADSLNFTYKENLVKAMDITLGLESLLLDTDDRRREMYGNAGSFRVKNYGIEYRTLSNFWIANNDLISWAYNNTMKAIELVNSGAINEIPKNIQTEIRNCIDSNDKDKVRRIQKKINSLKIKI